MTEARNLPGVILAGGLSRRMGGGDKSLCLMADRPLLQHVVDRLRPQAEPVALNANGDPARFAAFGLPVLPDTVAGHPGPLAGVLAGMDWAAGVGASHIVTVAADTPFFPTDLVERLQAGLSRGHIVLAAVPDPVRGTARQPTFGLWPVALRADLRQALARGVRKVVQWTDTHDSTTVTFEATAGQDPFFNVNTPADLEIARARIEESPA